MSLRTGCRGFLAALLLIAVVFAVPLSSFAQAPAPVAPASPAAPNGDDGASRTAEAIEPLRLNLEKIEKSVQGEHAADATLLENRGSLEPVRGELREIVVALEKRLADVDTRLKQIGQPPAADAPPEEASLAAERIRLNERRALLDSALKQTRLLVLRADNVSERITDRRRGLFTQQLFGRTSSALDPGFWIQATQALPDGLRGMILLGQGWMDHVRLSTSSGRIAAAGVGLIVLFAGVGLLLRWLGRQAFRPKELGTRFAKSFFAIVSLLRITLTAPAVIAIAVLILDAFGLMPERMRDVGFGLAAAVGVACFGRGVAVGLFAPDEPNRRLLKIRDGFARELSTTVIWAARILGVVVFVNLLQRAVIAPLSLTVATSAIFSAVIAILLSQFLFRSSRSESPEDEAAGMGWLRTAGWLLVAGIVAALVTGFIGFAAFLAGRFLVALGLIGALYIVLVFIDSLFTEVLAASTPRGRAVAHFFGLKPRSVELVGALLSAAIRLILILVVLLPLLGPWGVFAADLMSVIRDVTFGFRIGDVTISLTTVFGAFAIVAIGILATRAVQRWLDTSFLPRTTLDPSLQNSVSTIFGYLGVIVALSLAMAKLGVDFQQITLVAGALSIGIGFGLQSVVSNFVSGLILLAERPIRVGDVINVKGEEGRVRRIHVRATEIETGDRASVIIPNSELITQVVKNRTHTDTFAQVSVTLAVAYGSDVKKVRDILLEIAMAHPQVMQHPAPSVFVTGLGENGVNFSLGWVVRNLGDGAQTKSDVCFAILDRFHTEGIQIPYPRRDIHIQGLDTVEDEVEEPETVAVPAPKKPKRK